MLDAYEQFLYGLLLDEALRNKTGEEFQSFFAQVGEALWGTDFEGRRPQGRLGDGKCDGYHHPSKTVFQCYAPREMRPNDLTKKIDDDFAGARKHFKRDMRAWTLIHNDREDLPHTSHV